MVEMWVILGIGQIAHYEWGGNPPFQDWKSLVILIPVPFGSWHRIPYITLTRYGSQLS